jgi:hypothetical protein
VYRIEKLKKKNSQGPTKACRTIYNNDNNNNKKIKSKAIPVTVRGGL